MRYVEAKRKEEREILAYRIYISDSLFYQGQQMRLTHRYVDMIKAPEPEDNRTGDEIALDVINRLGLKVENNECI